MPAKRITALVMILLLGSSADARLLPGGVPARAILKVTTRLALTTVQGLTVTAGAIGATNPQSIPSPNTGVTVNWSQKQANNTTWTLTVQVPSQTTLTSCTTTPVPVTAVKVTCNSVSAANSGGWNGSCVASDVTLSSGSTITLATGNTGNANPQKNVTANITYSFTDDFKYVAVNSCTLPLTYTVSG